jgi:hypothetical protein
MFPYFDLLPILTALCRVDPAEKAAHPDEKLGAGVLIAFLRHGYAEVFHLGCSRRL